jgi:prepilin-type N-terminal cleavage/methylation domain-containing protein
MKSIHNHKGFTIIELLISTAVFSLVLIIFLSAFIKIGDIFYKGVNTSTTQEAARNVLDNVSNDIKFSKGKPFYNFITPDATGMGYFCVGQHRYKFMQGKQVGAPGTAFGLLREDISGSGCPNPNIVAGSNPTELLNNRMQLNRMNLNCTTTICTVSILIVFYGSDPSVLTPNAQDQHAQCSGGITTSQFCATADYSSAVNEQIQS